MSPRELCPFSLVRKTDHRGDGPHHTRRQPVNQLPDAPERFAAQIADAQELNHIAVFLTGQAPFPEGYGCTIHLETP